MSTHLSLSLFRDEQETKKRPVSAFDEHGLQRTVEALVAEIQALYLADDLPWVVGYSGGKDSTAALQLVWMAVVGLPAEKRTKPVHVISTDTLVENPIVAAWATGSLAAMREAATAQGLPIEPHRLTPTVENSFWVCLIGKGYPSPRRSFRWCTERLKIRPSTAFLESVVSERGEAVLVLGTRKAESAARKQRMEALEASRIRERLVPSPTQKGALTYTPIESWSNDDVWMFLMQSPNPWGWTNKSLLTLYAGATEGGECPLVIDTSTPSCGNSRFGCWVCTLVEQDKSMSAMIQNDPAKEWMLPLLELRDELDVFNDRPDGDRHLRDFRRMSGRVDYMPGQARVIPGPYLQSARAEWLRKVLQAQRYVRENGPDEVRGIALISVAELEAIRRVWVHEKREVEDLLPGIYQDATGEPYPGEAIEVPLSSDEVEAIRSFAAGDELVYGLTRDLCAILRGPAEGASKALLPTMERYRYRSVEEAEDAAPRDGEGQGTLALPTRPEAPKTDVVALATRAAEGVRHVLPDAHRRLARILVADVARSLVKVPKRKRNARKNAALP
jgi:DNA sulfur modification protein DndC